MFKGNCQLLVTEVLSLLMVVDSLVAEHRLRACGLRTCGLKALERAGSEVVTHGLSCSAACRILRDAGSNSCLLHRQADC